MLSLKPAKSLLFLAIGSCLLGISAIFLTGLSLPIKALLCLSLIIFAVYESCKLLQKTTYSLIQFTIPDANQRPWMLTLKNGKTLEAKILPSTRVTHKIIILHFRALHEKRRINQIVLPSTIGSQSFHDLLVHLKTHTFT